MLPLQLPLIALLLGELVCHPVVIARHSTNLLYRLRLASQTVPNLPSAVLLSSGTSILSTLRVITPDFCEAVPEPLGPATACPAPTPTGNFLAINLLTINTAFLQVRHHLLNHRQPIYRCQAYALFRNSVSSLPIRTSLFSLPLQPLSVIPVQCLHLERFRVFLRG